MENKKKPRALRGACIIYKEYWFRLLLLERGILQDFFDQVLHVFFPVALAHGKAEVNASLESAACNDSLGVGVGNGVFTGELEVVGFGAHGERVHLGFGEAGNFEVAHGDDEAGNTFVELRRRNEVVLLAELGRGHGVVGHLLGGEVGGDVSLALQFAAHLLGEPTGEVAGVVRKVVGDIVLVLHDRFGVEDGYCSCGFSPGRINVLETGLATATDEGKGSCAEEKRGEFFHDVVLLKERF